MQHSIATPHQSQTESSRHIGIRFRCFPARNRTPLRLRISPAEGKVILTEKCICLDSSDLSTTSSNVTKGHTFPKFYFSPYFIPIT